MASSLPDLDELTALGRAAGLAAVGVAPADPFERTRADLEDRKAQGIHGGMNFTYRNPARSTTPERALPGARALVVGAYAYLAPTPAAPEPGPHGQVARYARADYYTALRHGLEPIAERLRQDNWRARVLADDNALVDREAARRAGLGWYGKNANLLLPGAGSWFVLGSVLTDAPLAPVPGEDWPADGCGTCTRCLDHCPTGAIIEPGVVDARRCLAWLLQKPGSFPREHRVALGARIYGCDDCQEVCPPNRRTARRTPQTAPLAVVADASDTWVDLLELFDLDDEALLAQFGRWYIPRREPRYLRRNALIVLGNTANARDERVAHVLRRALTDPDPMIRAHGVWSARRLGRDDLIAEAPALAQDGDPEVRLELTAPLPSRH